MRSVPALGRSPEEAVWRAGAWVDAPALPSFEDVEFSNGDYPSTTLGSVFPVEEWTEAYQAHRYYVRVYSYSDYIEPTAKAARTAFQEVSKIRSPEFYKACRRHRG